MKFTLLKALILLVIIVWAYPATCNNPELDAVCNCYRSSDSNCKLGSCKDEYYRDDESELMCSKCIENCKICTNGVTCKTCKDGFNKNAEETQCVLGGEGGENGEGGEGGENGEGGEGGDGAGEDGGNNNSSFGNHILTGMSILLTLVIFL